MEQSRARMTVSERNVGQRTSVMVPNNLAHEAWRPAFVSRADAVLTLMLQHIGTCLSEQAEQDNLETFSFSLHQLLRRVDSLFGEILPGLDKQATCQQRDVSREMLRRQQIWLQLQAINRTLDRITLLCHLLSDAIECVLDTLDNADLWLSLAQDERTLALKQVRGPLQSQTRQASMTPGPMAVAGIAERWEQMAPALMDRLRMWREQYHRLLPWKHLVLPVLVVQYHLDELDTAWAIVLDSATAIFGAILPHFRVIGREDREQISALLFDLMQRSDQMLIQFEGIRNPLASLIRYFAAVDESSS